MRTLLLTAALLTSCGQDQQAPDQAGASQNEDQKQVTPKEHAMYAMAVSEHAELPPCTTEQNGRLAFVKESKKFFECSTERWAEIDVSTIVAGTKGDRGEKGEKGEPGQAAKPATDHIFDSDGNDIGQVISSEVSAVGTIKVLLADGLLVDLHLSTGKIRSIYGEQIDIRLATTLNESRVFVENTIFSTAPYMLYKSGSTAAFFSFNRRHVYQNGERLVDQAAAGSSDFMYEFTAWQPTFADYPFATPLKIKKVEDN